MERRFILALRLSKPAVFFRKITVVNWLGRTTIVFFNVAAFQNPFAPQRRQAVFDIAVKTRITPRTGAIIDAHGFVLLDGTGVGFGGREFDFAHGHTDVGMKPAFDVNLFAFAQLFRAVPVLRSFATVVAVILPMVTKVIVCLADSTATEGGRFERIFGRDHKI